MSGGYLPVKRRRSTAVKVGAWGAGIVAVVAVVAASEEDYDYAAVCVDEGTQTRVDDEQCDDGSSGSHAGFYGGRGWYYLPRGTDVPALGVPVSGGSMSAPPPGRSFSAGFDPHGGVVSRGGFGHGFSSFGG